jgi:transcription antitermination protein NusB
MGIRRIARESALQALFMCDVLNIWDMESIEFCFQYFSISKAPKSFARVICSGVLEKKDAIDSVITRCSDNWSISRMGRVDRNLLRLATYELLYVYDTPSNVVINEAIEIARRFGAEESAGFINGVLDKIARSNRSTAIDKAIEAAASVFEMSQPIKAFSS